jgi:hypothetical protein
MAQGARIGSRDGLGNTGGFKAFSKSESRFLFLEVKYGGRLAGRLIFS